jgi:LmbE family N-acetylglucosaminyl deacetylase
MKRKSIRTTLALLVLSLFVTAPRAQQTLPAPAAGDRIELYQALLDLTNPWTVMCIAAHPDDEDGTSLIVMRRKFGAHTVSLFSTFGEGGQNAIGPELYEELGAIRARETMAAAEVQGSEPHFLGLKDFGFSKSPEEAFRVWGHQEALRRMVLEIRKLRPDVIITNHSVTNNDHGHHQATARLELEAFDAAADPNRFPEQLKDGVAVWQVQRLFVRAGRSNQTQTDTAPVVTIDPNERDPIRDTVFAEEALRALQKHATQGPWPKTFADMLRFRNSQDGKLPVTRYVLTREAKGAEALPQESHNFLDGLRLPETMAQEIRADLTIQGKPLMDFIDQRDQLITSLSSLQKRMADRFLKARSNGSALEVDKGVDARSKTMLVRLDATLAVLSGISLTLRSPGGALVPGTSTNFSLEISNRGTNDCLVDVALFARAEGAQPANFFRSANRPPRAVVAPKQTTTLKLQYATPVNSDLTVPHSAHLTEGSGPGQRFFAAAHIETNGTTFSVGSSTTVDVVPAIEIASINPSPALKTPPDRKTELRGTMDCMLRDFDYRVRLTNHQDAPFSGQLIVGPGFGRRAAYHPITIAAHDTADLTVSVPGCPLQINPKTASEEKAAPISFSVVGNGATKPLARLEVPIVFADARVAPKLHVGYLRGFDFSLPNALAALSVASKELRVDEVKSADLQQYTTIIVDNRAYESTPGLIAANQKLLDYAKAGGTLIVFYHKSFEWNPDERRQRPQLAPYKLILGDERITDETAPITFTEPQHPLLNSPNKIGPEDFANWIQERGLYYPKEWDPQFHALLQSNDPNEAPLKGGLLAADYGRGHYIYTSMVWYRELRAGVPGAYRMLANMISYGQEK